MRERVDQSKEFQDRAWPSVNQHQGDCVRSRRSFVDEVDRLSIDLGGELIESVDQGLLRAPVIIFLPIVCEFADLADVSAVFPGRARQLIGPLGLRQAAPSDRRARYPEYEL